ncbi:hypothetical protein QTN25_001860 [Entamoeba marina]
MDADRLKQEVEQLKVLDEKLDSYFTKISSFVDQYKEQFPIEITLLKKKLYEYQNISEDSDEEMDEDSQKLSGMEMS